MLPAFAGTDRFRVLRQLGAGGFGVVYEVVDRERDATVALKVLRRADPEHLYRLKQEFRALAEISHPNLVSFYELLSDNGRWFFTMELVSGTDFVGFVRGIVPVPRLAETKTTDSVSRATRQIDDVDPAADAPTAALSDAATPPTLPAVVAQSGLDFARLRQALKQLGHGLTYLHSLGKLHRDIKSANVMVTPEGRVVLLDFGLVMDRDAEISDPAMNVAGTLEYMAPEQFGGDGPHPAADWYAVGVLMFRALTARYPFNGNAMEMWNAKQRQAPPQAREFVPGLPEDLNALCRDLLAKEPARRPTGDQFLARLGASAPTLSIVYPVSAASRAPFVGRQAELRALESAYAAGKAGQATTVYLHGTSGIGKTALVRHFLEDLQRRDEDTLVFAGRCYEQESVPYKALDSLVDALSQYLRERPPSEVESVLPRDIADAGRSHIRVSTRAQ